MKGGFHELDDPCDTAVVLEEEVVPSFEPGLPSLDPPVSPPVVGNLAEAMTSSTEAVVAPHGGGVRSGRPERAPPRHQQDYVLNVVRHTSRPPPPPLLRHLAPLLPQELSLDHTVRHCRTRVGVML
ncbi:hypothetical protein LIER_00817 [Lithospermum erythrorhizon]|uniref:Uncharacterized protein n=1 Tax=Lithospermum erythrorhizon TaxID=34254 RepID=A0AAV3NIR5_LITER